MTVDEYVEKSKIELDNMAKMFKDNHEKDPNGWPVEMEEDDWTEQELAARFQ
jgi:hypothetical protein